MADQTTATKTFTTQRRPALHHRQRRNAPCRHPGRAAARSSVPASWTTFIRTFRPPSPRPPAPSAPNRRLDRRNDQRDRRPRHRRAGHELVAATTLRRSWRPHRQGRGGHVRQGRHAAADRAGHCAEASGRERVRQPERANDRNVDFRHHRKCHPEPGLPGRGMGNYADNAARTPRRTSTSRFTPPTQATPGPCRRRSRLYQLRPRAGRADDWRLVGGQRRVHQPGGEHRLPDRHWRTGTGTHFSTGKTGGGAAAILWSGTITPNITFGNGVMPR
jgi:hypothetical protein